MDLSKQFSGVQIDRQNIFTVLGQMMKKVELISNLSGMQKAQMVIDQIKGLISENKSLSDSDRAFLLSITNEQLGHIMTLVVNAASLGINLARRAVAGCCG